jgi:hypothetical protein
MIPPNATFQEPAFEDLPENHRFHWTGSLWITEVAPAADVIPPPWEPHPNVAAEYEIQA